MPHKANAPSHFPPPLSLQLSRGFLSPLLLCFLSKQGRFQHTQTPKKLQQESAAHTTGVPSQGHYDLQHPPEEKQRHSARGGENCHTRGSRHRRSQTMSTTAAGPAVQNPTVQARLTAIQIALTKGGETPAVFQFFLLFCSGWQIWK